MNSCLKWYIYLLFSMSSSLYAITSDEWKALAGAETLTVFFNNQSVGEMVTSCTVQNTFITTESRLKTSMSDGGQGRIVATINEKKQYDLQGSLIRAYQEMRSPAGTNYWKLEQSESKEWVIKIVTGGIETLRNVKWANEKLFNIYNFQKGMITSSLKPGDNWKDTILELTSGELVIATTTCIEIPSESNNFTWKFHEKNSINQKDEAWVVDKNRRTVYREIFPFIVKPGVGVKSGGSSVNIFEMFKVPATRSAEDNEDIALTGDSNFSIDSSVLKFYKIINSKYVLIPPRDNCTKKFKSEHCPDSLRPFLAATPTLQIKSSEILSLSEQLQRGETICDQIRSLNDYVFKSLKKEYTAAFSSALETYKAGFGDCGEHAVLLAALLRASKIPARVVFGAVYMQQKRGYFYHAWVMAHNGENWLFADPALGTFPANTDRIPLLIDDTGDKMIALSKVIGRLKVEYISNRN